MGAVFSIYGGLISQSAGDLLAGRLRYADVAVPDADFVVPAMEPGLIRPVRTRVQRRNLNQQRQTHSAERYDELSVRALTGAGAEKAVAH